MIFLTDCSKLKCYVSTEQNGKAREIHINVLSYDFSMIAYRCYTHAQTYSTNVNPEDVYNTNIIHY